jgi:hypothetical protein
MALWMKLVVAWVVLLAAAMAFTYVVWTAATPQDRAAEAERRPRVR